MDGIILILTSMLTAALTGYISTTLMEKHSLMVDNMPHNLRGIDQEVIEGLSPWFTFRGHEMMAGDELAIALPEMDIFKAIIVGANSEKQEIVVLRNGEVQKLDNEEILAFRVLSKYGQFFNTKRKRG